MVKLLHLADLHLSGPLYVTSDALLKRMRAAQRTAFRRAIGCALQEEVEAVLIAGGLFDERYLDVGTEQFMVQQLARLDEAGIRCFYATGPADPGDAGGRGADIDWPSSLHRFADPAPETVTLTNEEGRPLVHIVGTGHSEGTSQQRPPSEKPHTTAFPDATEALPYVGLFHDGSSGASGEAASDRRDPARQAAMREAGYAYWALGGASQPHQAVDEATQAWYAGPLMGRRPPQVGPQGGLLVAIEAEQKPHVSFQALAPLYWADLTLSDLEAVRTPHALLRRAQRAFLLQQSQQAFEEGQGDDVRTAWLARFTLTGACPLASSLHERSAQEELEAMLAEHLDLEGAFVRLRHLTVPADPDSHRQEAHVLSETLSLLDQAASDAALLRELAPDELAALPDDDDPDAYLCELVETLDREACAHLLRRAPSQ